MVEVSSGDNPFKSSIKGSDPVMYHCTYAINLYLMDVGTFTRKWKSVEAGVCMEGGMGSWEGTSLGKYPKVCGTWPLGSGSELS